MSYILDALKRSEQERQRAELPMQTAVALDPVDTPKRRWPLWAGAVLVAINLIVLGMLFWDRDAAPRPQFQTQTPAPAPIVSPPQSGSSASLAELAGSDQEQPILARRTPPAQPQRRPRAAETAPARPAPTRQAAAAPAPASAQTPASAPASEAVDDAPELAALPEHFRSRLPPIPVNVHVFAEEPSARWVLVDMKRYGENSQLPSGVRIERITPTGLVLAYQGQRFHLTVR